MTGCGRSGSRGPTSKGRVTTTRRGPWASHRGCSGPTRSTFSTLGSVLKSARPVWRRSCGVRAPKWWMERCRTSACRRRTVAPSEPLGPLASSLGPGWTCHGPQRGRSRCASTWAPAPCRVLPPSPPVPSTCPSPRTTSTTWSANCSSSSATSTPTCHAARFCYAAPRAQISPSVWRLRHWCCSSMPTTVLASVRPLRALQFTQQVLARRVCGAASCTSPPSSRGPAWTAA
mmetsp:Transcript_55351/g.98522  ORF Transcript_55351/g.98522 Transcript_55351/m.98522 type:complete len:231 (-) Transcript_55351:242-934(-)